MNPLTRDALLDGNLVFARTLPIVLLLPVITLKRADPTGLAEHCREHFSERSVTG